MAEKKKKKKRKEMWKIDGIVVRIKGVKRKRREALNKKVYD